MVRRKKGKDSVKNDQQHHEARKCSRDFGPAFVVNQAANAKRSDCYEKDLDLDPPLPGALECV